MTANIKRLTGEELLLIAVLGGPDERVRIGQELDRRALWGSPPRLGRASRTCPVFADHAFVRKAA